MVTIKPVRSYFEISKVVDFLEKRISDLDLNEVLPTNNKYFTLEQQRKNDLK
jgi:hypothetical protein